MYDLIVIGGGAAGFFGALSAKRAAPNAQVLLLEKTAVLLSKVRISGGGRCNVTHSCFDPKLLTQNYPRGHKELLGPFFRFQPQDTVEWFETRGVPLKTEKDGRMFPKSDSSESIIKCLLQEAEKLNVEIRLRQNIASLEKEGDFFKIIFKEGEAITCKKVLLATGSSPAGHELAKKLGHTLQAPVPSLFTFNVPTSDLKELSGISLSKVELTLKGTSFVQVGPLLITHFGFSGPAALKLSAWSARYFFEKGYKVELVINWLPNFSFEEILKKLKNRKEESPQKNLMTENLFEFPKNLWQMLTKCISSSKPLDKPLAELGVKDLEILARKLHADLYQIEGKTTHKEEFVTCGGVTLKEVNFKTMESKITPGLYFAGEVLDSDGVTGGFNFQNAWTTGFISGSSIFL